MPSAACIPSERDTPANCMGGIIMRERCGKVTQRSSHIKFCHERDIVFTTVRPCHYFAGCSPLLCRVPDTAIWRISAFHARYTLNRYPSATALVCPATCHRSAFPPTSESHPVRPFGVHWRGPSVRRCLRRMPNTHR